MPVRRSRPAENRTTLASWMRLRRPPLICGKRGDEAYYFNSEFKILDSEFELSVRLATPAAIATGNTAALRQNELRW